MSDGRTPREMMAYALEMDEALVPFAHELLADLSELGSDGPLIVDVLARLGIDAESLVVDLGCGKGAVAIAVARRFGCSVVGIDLHDGLISDARRAASVLGLDRCQLRRRRHRRTRRCRRTGGCGGVRGAR